MINFSPEEQASHIACAIRFLELNGYSVTLGTQYRDFITCKDFAAMLPFPLGRNGLHRRLKHPECPAFEAETGDSGRIIKLKPNAQLLRFCSQPIQKGKRILLRPATELQVQDFHHDNGS